MSKRRRLLVPEVIQASAMDCGPASLKCLLEGYGISASLGRLREACQTDVDGTSIDTIEDIAVRLGLDAEQIMSPLDHLLLPDADPLPALVVVRLPGGLTHFVVAWRRHGPFVQLMDPGTGRRWQRTRRFLEECYVHTNAVAASDWRQWAGSEGFLTGLRRRLGSIGIASSAIEKLTRGACADEGWRPLAALDAATRMTESITCAGGLHRGRESLRVLEHFFSHSGEIPEEYWQVRPAPPSAGPDQLLLRGAVLISVRGRTERKAAEEARPLPPELATALSERPSRPGRDLLRLMRADGVFAPGSLILALMLAAGGVLLEALLFRGFFDLGRELGLSGQRLAALAAMLLLGLILLLLEFPLAAGVLRMGRHLENRLRIAFLEKIPRLGDRYFQSRTKSDMAQRSHSIHSVRNLPVLGGQLARSAFELILTAAGIAWLDPPAAPLAAASAAVALLLPFLAQPALTERDLRVRSHLGALSQYYLDALLGLIPIRAHGAERTLRREHEGVLAEWARASFGLQRFAVTIEALQFLTGFGMAAWVLLNHLARRGESGGVLLLVYWALNLPVLGQEIAQIAWQYPGFRNATLRLLEPLGALEEVSAISQEVSRSTAGPAVAIALENVTVRAAGNTILEDIDVAIPAGSHVAIVGASGAGKSSLVGLLLGWHRPAEGRALVDGVPLDNARLEHLRPQIAWVDPQVRLWNRSFVDNLRYGSGAGAELSISDAIETAALVDVLKKLPDGLQTSLGEGGALLSGGQGQRVRFGRALLRGDARLVILDEPFRGLDREQRGDLLARARIFWQGATLLCITHDVGETLSFERVLVLERGRVVEDGRPALLASRPDSKYRAMLDAEEAVREGLWSADSWRRLRLEGGVLIEEASLGRTPKEALR